MPALPRPERVLSRPRTVIVCVCHAPCSVLEGHASFVTDVALSQNGSRAVTASGDGTARLWDTSR
jgi:WD40 repeat protein